MESRKKNIFICLYIALWLAQAWLTLVRRAPLTAVVLAVIYILVLTERKLSHYILYGWCGFCAVIAAGNIYAYRRRPSEETNVLALILALTVAPIILTVLFRRQLKAAVAEKERAQAEKRRRRLDAKTAREQRGKGRSE